MVDFYELYILRDVSQIFVIRAFNPFDDHNACDDCMMS